MEDYLIEKRLKQINKNGHLTNDQNNLLLEEYRADLMNGVMPEESDARALLILGNHRLILHTLKSKFRTEYLFDPDTVSVGKMALVKAIDSYNKDRNVEFSSYAVGCIRYEVFNYFRDLKSKRQMPDQQLFIEDYIVGTEEKQNNFKHLTILDTLQDDEDVVKFVQDSCMAGMVEKNIKYLNRNEAICVMLSYGLFDLPRLTRVEIGKRLNISHSSVVRYNTIALQKLKVLMSPDKELTVEERQLKQRTLKNGISNDLILRNENNIEK